MKTGWLPPSVAVGRWHSPFRRILLVPPQRFLRCSSARLARLGGVCSPARSWKEFVPLPPLACSGAGSRAVSPKYDCSTGVCYPPHSFHQRSPRVPKIVGPRSCPHAPWGPPVVPLGECSVASPPLFGVLRPFCGRFGSSGGPRAGSQRPLSLAGRSPCSSAFARALAPRDCPLAPLPRPFPALCTFFCRFGPPCVLDRPPVRALTLARPPFASSALALGSAARVPPVSRPLVAVWPPLSFKRR